MIKPIMSTKKVRLKGKDPKEAAPSKPKILIFGAAGVGKTWASLDFPKCYYIDTESGADLNHYTDKLKKAGGVYFGPEDGSVDFGEIIGQVQALATESHDYKTLIIDSITVPWNATISDESEKLGEKDAFGASKKPAIHQMRRLVNWVRRVDMNVIFIAHEKAEWSKGEQIGWTFDCWDKLEYELHLALQIRQSGDSRTAFIRKSRLTEFPPKTNFPWSYEEFAKRYGEEVIQKEATSIELATDDQVTELQCLLQRVKVDEDWLSKCLAKAGAETPEEFTTEQIQKLIKHLEGKIKV